MFKLFREKKDKYNRKCIWRVQSLLSNQPESETGFKIQFDEISEQDFLKMSSALSNCSNLQVLNLNFDNHCVISDQSIQALATSLQNCKNVFYFSLRLNCLDQLTEKGVQDLGLILERFKDLTKLKLQIKCLNDEKSKQILFQALAKCLKLQFLALIFNWFEFEDADAKYLGVCLSNCVNLTTFKLKSLSQKMGYKGIQDLFFALTNCSKLSTILIEIRFKYHENDYEHQLDQIGICSALPYFPKLSKLKLELHKEVIGAKSLLDLGNDLAGCSNLQILELSFMNEMSSKCTLELGSALAKSSSLSILKLDLSQNKIDDEGVSNLGFTLKNCSKLSNLDLNLAENNFGKQGVSHLITYLSSNTSLTTLKLNLQQNKLDDEAVSGIGSSFIKSSKIRNLTLELMENEIDKQGVKELGSAFQSWDNIQIITIDISYNKLRDKSESEKLYYYMFKMKRLVQKYLGYSYYNN
ncbi:kinase domain protein (macronuclear) [Tetrahymena thermophila SB210]|uniref:Kinase domain protein n=1 Tax=Tetrahymena thermophila (strain SB210) TaxID=312017 RepID=W7XA33_TETTS|nr:kinase domain protein [Tetrahymena thermophila SB210]EWS74187.1 kinase domain protein [Tetrahymena thermophila SB210]|eukprot:XP_012653279.1 kinase domain protein [Tetrahymena thermophila SB210]